MRGGAHCGGRRLPSEGQSALLAPTRILLITPSYFATLSLKIKTLEPSVISGVFRRAVPPHAAACSRSAIKLCPQLLPAAQEDNTALALAARYGYRDCVAKLIAAGADCAAQNEVRR